ncbi:hypothetical protein [Aliikangiella coralliicola]|uniref:Uncharacterized protein n=1 Tax=Aliikangiella coralliicola TaxID=2592383 RepID=A0A545U8Q2_9GAMM|nr:hypothetical protein [Aliikangiella coralliicola]TQV85783.1 hypothetical protein FLL46_17820 [Aliikangiella coralliicola]
MINIGDISKPSVSESPVKPKRSKQGVAKLEETTALEAASKTTVLEKRPPDDGYPKKKRQKRAISDEKNKLSDSEKDSSLEGEEPVSGAVYHGRSEQMETLSEENRTQPNKPSPGEQNTYDKRGRKTPQTRVDIKV